MSESVLAGLGYAFDDGGFSVEALGLDVLAIGLAMFVFGVVDAMAEEVLGEFVGVDFGFAFGGGGWLFEES